MTKHKYVYADTDRHGNARRYFWRGKGHKKIRLHADPGSHEYNVELLNAHNSSRRTAPFKLDSRLRGYVYFLKVAGRIKIGFSQRPSHRLTDLRTGLPGPIQLFAFVPGAVADERRLHKRLAPFRVDGEWFKDARPVRTVISRAIMLGEINLPTFDVTDRREKKQDGKL